jgi:beta-galactosidase
VDASSPVPRVPVVFEDVFRYVDARNKNKKSYGKIDQEWVNEALIQAEGLINGQVVAKHQRWPVGRKRRLVLKVDDSAVPPLADGSDITPVVAYLVDAGGAVKRLSDEYIRFSVSGEGTLIGGPEKGMNPQKLLWGEAVALIRSGVKPGTITVRAEVLEPGTNAPESAKIEFQTNETGKNRLYKELPTQTKQQTDESSFLDENQILKSLREELRKTQKELQEYRINEVGRQQQDFIQ